MTWITENLEALVSILTATVTLASLIANLTKTDSDNKAVGIISKVVNFLALNFKNGSIAPK